VVLVTSDFRFTWRSLNQISEDLKEKGFYFIFLSINKKSIKSSSANAKKNKNKKKHALISFILVFYQRLLLELHI